MANFIKREICFLMKNPITYVSVLLMVVIVVLDRNLASFELGSLLSRHVNMFLWTFVVLCCNIDTYIRRRRFDRA